MRSPCRTVATPPAGEPRVMPRHDDPGGWRSSIECLWRQNDNSEAIIHSPVKRERISILPPSLEQLLKVQTELAAIGGLEDEAAVRRQVAALNVEIAKTNAAA